MHFQFIPVYWFLLMFLPFYCCFFCFCFCFFHPSNPDIDQLMTTSSNGNIFRVTGPWCGGIHRWPVNSPLKGQWRGAFIFPLICAWTHGWANNGDAGDLIRHPDHYDVTVMWPATCWLQTTNSEPTVIRMCRFSASLLLVHFIDNAFINTLWATRYLHLTTSSTRL